MTGDLIIAKLVESIPYIVGGLIAFGGGIAGHFLNHWLTSSHRKTERLREQLLALIESIYADESWLEQYRTAMCFGVHNMDDSVARSKLALIQQLFFPALSAERHNYEVARNELVQNILKVRSQRLTDAQQLVVPGVTAEQALGATPPKQNLVDDVLSAFNAYWLKQKGMIDAAIKIGHDKLKLK